MKLTDFIKQHESEAMSLNLSDYESINQVLQKYVFMLENAETEDERKEVSDFAGKAIKDLKNRLYLHLKNNAGIGNYINHIPPYLWDIRLLIEYRKLYDKATTATPEANQNNEEVENPYPEIFKGIDNKAFLVFDTFAKKHIIDRYADYSFIFHAMKPDHLHNVKHIDFMNWLKEKEYISERTFDTFLSKGSFSKKYNSSQRLNTYNNLLNEVFK